LPQILLFFQSAFTQSVLHPLFALRTLRKSPAFTTVAVASLALGIGANAAIFSFVNAILLKQLPVPEPERLVTFSQIFRGEPTGKVWDITTIAELAKRDPAFSSIFGRCGRTISFSTGHTARWVLGELVTGQYFRTLQAKPFAGRLLTDDDTRDAAANPVCVLSYEIWQRELGGDRAAVGRTVFLNEHPYRVVGVTAKGFAGADMQHRIGLRIPATRIGDFMPAFGNATDLDWLNISWLSAMARLKPGISRVEAQVQTRQLLDQIQKSGKSEETLQLGDGSRGFDTTRLAFGRPALVLMAVVALVLLV
jgi:putative ABC transport system permease protein